MPLEADYRRGALRIQKVQKLSNISNAQQTATGQPRGARVAVGHRRVLSLYHPSLQYVSAGLSRILGPLQPLPLTKGP